MCGLCFTALFSSTFGEFFNFKGARCVRARVPPAEKLREKEGLQPAFLARTVLLGVVTGSDEEQPGERPHAHARRSCAPKSVGQRTTDHKLLELSIVRKPYRSSIPNPT